VKSTFPCPNSVFCIIFAFLSFGISLVWVWKVSANPELPPVIVNEKDGSEMVLIPAGEFLMGSPTEAIAPLLKNDPKISADLFRAEGPQHLVTLAAFYMERYLVTNAQYRVFMRATGHPAPKYWNDAPDMGAETPFPMGSEHPGHPVVGVSYVDAVAYCTWAGGRLPTEAEWEKAARGGLVGQNYPWGNQLSREYANYGGMGGRNQWPWTAPVGSFPPNAYGLYDMAGNAFEWCADWYAEDYYRHSPDHNPYGPETGHTRVLCGGSWNNNLFGMYQMRCAFRFHARPETQNLVIGFRCVSDVPPPQ